MSELRAFIREILEEELALIKSSAIKADIKQEIVSIGTDKELANFVRHLIKLSENPRIKNQLLEGDYVFKLNSGDIASQVTVQPPQTTLPTKTQAINLDAGLVTEKDVKKFPADLNLITVTDAVCFTPLANDELRRRRIKIERRTS